MRPRFFVWAGVIATVLFSAGWGALWAAERVGPAQRVTVETSVQSQAIFRREDVRPTLTRPSADAREFFFTRAIYNGGGRRWGAWATDYPKADRQFLTILDRLVDLDAYELENAIQLDDPNVRKFPFLYALEVGNMYMTESEVKGLRDYLLAGGFLMIDDFWGTWEWENFETEIRRVLPEYQIVEIPLDHPIFNTVYNIEEIVQVPNLGNAQRGARTWERDGVVPHVRGIFDEDGRLMVIINWNTDIGDAWEWAEHPYYPLRYSTYAIEITVNIIVYAMSH
ncbi:MAG: DUF4159 domain-containing protein [Vicinamibacterales bacterium]|nr:DUF4159 domain-containing protein [Vicinamibacterales bacterium]MDP7480677.1 DUF4159 domain-containing protein [Vicinamibacterales bacterium]HJN46588.1 DUF4159 domain-containing protein [Vicinamibacterales bacterium]